MPRREPPNLEPAPVVAKSRPDTITQHRHYQLITPLYGGGSETGQADPVTIVRGAEVRGQLRFWWRATRGGHYQGDLAAMRAAEELLWGAASKASRVQLAVMVTQRGTVLENVNSNIYIASPKSPYGYALFPLQEKHQLVRQNIAFILTITFREEDKAEVAATLWAWETFGGLGGRTRRGCGALQCDTITTYDAVTQSFMPEEPDLPQNPQSVTGWLTACLQHHVLSGRWPDNVPHLTHAPQHYKTISGGRTGLEAWQGLLYQLKAFRQSRPNQYTNHPRRSRWPEPDQIRWLTKQNHPDHRVKHPVEKFPRVAFGLPIVFHFKNNNREGNDPNENLDPRDTILHGKLLPGSSDKYYDRLASRLILRPLACSGDRQYIGLAAILVGPSTPPGGLLLKEAKPPLGSDPRSWEPEIWSNDHPIDPTPVNSDLTANEAAEIKTSDGRYTLLGGETDPLFGFLKFLS